MSIDFSNASLLIPNRFDVEREAVATAWKTAGGDVICLSFVFK